MWTLVALSGALALGKAPVTPAPITAPIFPGQARPALPANDPRTTLPTPFGVPPGVTIAVEPDDKATSQAPPVKNGSKEDEPKNGNGEKKEEPKEEVHGFFRAFFKTYKDEFFPKDLKRYGSDHQQEGDEKKKEDEKKDEPAPEPEKPRRAMPSPWWSPPFPGHEYQGYPLLGVPADDPSGYPIMKGLYATPCGDAIKDSKIFLDGWVTASGNWSTAKNSNVPSSYWIVPNRYELDQLVFKLERVPDTVQTDHIDWGFRFISMYGMDYRYTTAGGWGSDQLLEHNLLYGWDPTEVYVNAYIPGFLGGTDIRVGRWIACPDIETQYAPDNYLGSHSILFTYDTYTQTGVMVSQKLNDQWMVQGVAHAGTDMAPWYKGSLLTGALGVRWVSEDNNNAFYTWLNSINSAQFRHFQQYGQPLGHDNFNYLVTTWEHRITHDGSIHTKTEAYYMWQNNAEVGGTPSAGPVKPFGGGGGDGVLIPGYTQAWGVLNYTMFALSQQDYLTLRNEVYVDDSGFRTGTRGTYTSHTIGLSHNFNNVFQVRPEIGYYRNWHQDAFDNQTTRGIWLYGFDVTLRF
jgi:hypothetical protein